MFCKKTVGSHAVELLSKKDPKINVIDMQRSMLSGQYSEKSYEEEVYETLQKGLKDSRIEGDFYIVVLTKRERLLPNVIRNLFHYRQTCPSPQYDQIVYQCHRSSKTVNFLWCLPSQQACETLPMQQKSLPLDEMKLISYIKDFYNGNLLKKAMILNKELAN